MRLLWRSFARGCAQLLVEVAQLVLWFWVERGLRRAAIACASQAGVEVAVVTHRSDAALTWTTLN